MTVETDDRPAVGTEAAKESELSKQDNHQNTGTPTPCGFAEVLDFLQQLDRPHDRVSVCWKRPGDEFKSLLLAAEDAPRQVERLKADYGIDGDMWFGVNPVDSTVAKGRGTAKDVTRLAALYADVDVKVGACPDLKTAHGVIDDLSVVLGQRPGAIIYSGHGLQPIWPVDRESAESLTNAQAQTLARRFGRLVSDIGTRREVALDTVSDLARVLRVPDTTNVKFPDRPVPTRCEADTGTALTVEEIAQALDDYGLTELLSDAAFTGTVICAPEGWTYGTTDCRYVMAMVQAWGKKSDEPKGGRHPWAMNRAVRLAAASRLGCITETGLRASLEYLEHSLQHWCNTVGEPRPLQPDEIESAYRWGMEKVATLTDQQAHAELGNHKCQSADSELTVTDDSMGGVYTDVAALLDGGLPDAPRPEILTRADGVSLFYRGEVNILFGDPEHGKTWFGLAACAQVLQQGGRVLVIDLDHNGASAIISRLLHLGAPVEALRDRDRFRHCDPGEKALVMQAVTDCAVWRPKVILMDSTGELLPMFDASSIDADDFTKVHNKVLQPLAATGAAVVLVDHPAKARESRQIGPGGTMAKRRTVGGLSLRVVRERPYTKSGGGVSKLLVNKDRHGGVRDHCAAPRPGKDNDEQLAGLFVLDAADDGVAGWRIIPPDTGTADRPFRPTALMEKAGRIIEAHPGELTRDGIAKQTGSRKQHALAAVDLLVAEGYATRSEGRKYRRYTSVQPYRQFEDPESDQNIGLTDRLRRHTDADGEGAS